MGGAGEKERGAGGLREHENGLCIAQFNKATGEKKRQERDGCSSCWSMRRKLADSCRTMQDRKDSRVSQRRACGKERRTASTPSDEV